MQLFSSSSQKGLCFCPVNYLSAMSRCLDDCSLYRDVNISTSVMLEPAKVSEGSAVSIDSSGYRNKLPLDKQSVLEEVFNFFEAHNEKPVMVSLMDQCVMALLVAAVLVPLLHDHKLHETKAVGNRVVSLTCELCMKTRLGLLWHLDPSSRLVTIKVLELSV